MSAQLGSILRPDRRRNRLRPVWLVTLLALVAAVVAVTLSSWWTGSISLGQLGATLQLEATVDEGPFFVSIAVKRGGATLVSASGHFPPFSCELQGDFWSPGDDGGEDDDDDQQASGDGNGRSSAERHEACAQLQATHGFLIFGLAAGGVAAACLLAADIWSSPAAVAARAGDNSADGLGLARVALKAGAATLSLSALLMTAACVTWMVIVERHLNDEPALTRKSLSYGFWMSALSSAGLVAAAATLACAAFCTPLSPSVIVLQPGQQMQLAPYPGAQWQRQHAAQPGMIVLQPQQVQPPLYPGQQHQHQQQSVREGESVPMLPRAAADVSN